MKILNFGSCNIDYVYSLDHIVRIGETETTNKMEVFPGGKGLNQSIAAARAGAEVFHAACIGEDGKMLEDILRESGADTSYLRKVNSKNGHAIIQVSSEGDNSIFLYPGSNEMVSKEFIDEVLENFGAGDIILLQNEISNVDYIVDKAYKKNMKIVFNPSPYNEKIEKIDVSKLFCLILNEIEAEQMTGFKDTKDALDYFKNNYPTLKVMLTLGKDGCVFADGDLRISRKIFAVKTVDTTGAGDTFTGYFIAGIANGEDFAEILKTASAASAIAVSKKGAAPSIPERDEVLSFLGGLR